MENNTLRDTLKAAGLDLFVDRRSHAKDRAQDCLAGRTHYADPDTLRHFKSRILSAQTTSSDTLFYVIESASLDPGHMARGFRGVVFDIFGTAVYRPALEECSKTADGARKAMWAWLNTFSESAHYAECLARRAALAEREALALREAVAAIDACEVTA